MYPFRNCTISGKSKPVEIIFYKSRAAYSLTRRVTWNKRRAISTFSKAYDRIQKVFGTLANGAKINEFRLINDKGTEVSILEWRLYDSEQLYPTETVKKKNISLGFNNLEDYVEKALISDALLAFITESEILA